MLAIHVASQPVFIHPLTSSRLDLQTKSVVLCWSCCLGGTDWRRVAGDGGHTLRYFKHLQATTLIFLGLVKFGGLKMQGLRQRIGAGTQATNICKSAFACSRPRLFGASILPTVPHRSTASQWRTIPCQSCLTLASKVAAASNNSAALFVRLF
jgi:hypothetical protein